MCISPSWLSSRVGEQRDVVSFFIGRFLGQRSPEQHLVFCPVPENSSRRPFQETSFNYMAMHAMFSELSGSLLWSVLQDFVHIVFAVQVLHLIVVKPPVLEHVEGLP
jgi:hypothetical protein